MKFSIVKTIFYTVTASLLVISFPVLAELDSSEANKAKQFTVEIDNNLDDEHNNHGSGVIIEKNNNTYTVLTNCHVIFSVDMCNDTSLITQEVLRRQIAILIGNNREITNYQTVKYLPGIDLAIVQFNSSNNYQVANMNTDIYELQNVYVTGYILPTSNYPQGGYAPLSTSIRAINANREDGYEIILRDSSQAGSSGGAVIDDNANLVGINGESFEFNYQTNTQVGAAIPISIFLNRRNNFISPPGITIVDNNINNNSELPLFPEVGDFDLPDKLKQKYFYNVKNSLNRLKQQGRSFYCGTDNGFPATIYQSDTGAELALIQYVTEYSNYSSQSLCQRISNNFEINRRNGTLMYIVPSFIDDHPVICASRTENGTCDHLLFPVPYGMNADEILENFMQCNNGFCSPLQL